MTYITIFGRSLPIYSLIGVAGIIAGIGAMFFLCKYLKKDYQDSITFLVFTMVGALVGSKILFFIVSWRDIANDWGEITKNFLFFINKYIYGGLVFYGALIGGIITAFLYCKIRKQKFSEEALPLVTVVPLIHGIARIGCHVVGCCYGVQTDLPIGIVYHNSIAAPPDVALMPVQLMESGCNIIIFILLLIAVKKKDTFYSLGLYACLYSIVRFILEFFRGDIVRGFVGVLSTSQFISIFLLVFGICCLIYSKKAHAKLNSEI
jgi:phosphatidylglycerol:prolipoprotein diacylglycerol transferase